MVRISTIPCDTSALHSLSSIPLQIPLTVGPSESLFRKCHRTNRCSPHDSQAARPLPRSPCDLSLSVIHAVIQVSISFPTHRPLPHSPRFVLALLAPQPSSLPSSSPSSSHPVTNVMELTRAVQDVCCLKICQLRG